MSIGQKDFGYFHRLEGAVRLLATSTDSPRRKVELAFTSYLVPLIPLEPNDSIDEKLCQALALATKYDAQWDEGTIRATMTRVKFSTLKKIMTLIFEAYREMQKEFAQEPPARTQ